MVETLPLLLPAAIGFALSPIPLVEMILVLMSKRPKSNGLVFLAAIALPVFAVPLLSAEGVVAGSHGQAGASPVKSVILLLVGALLLTMAARNFANRRDKSVPKMFAAIDDMGPLGVVALSGGATIFNPKNLVLLLGAGAIAGASALPIGQLLAVLGVFTAVAMLPFSLAVGYVALGGPAAAERMQRVKQWLLDNNRMVLAVVLGLLGLIMTAKAVASLLA